MSVNSARKSIHESWPIAAWGLALCGGLLALYWPSVHTPYFFDDFEFFRHAEGARVFAAPAWWSRRFISYLTFYWIDQIFPQKIEVQRLFSLALHAGNAFLLFLLLRRVTALLSISWGVVAAGVTWFAISPAAFHAVAYLQQRSIVLATFFALLSWLAWIRFLSTSSLTRWVALAVSGGAFLLAIFSKEQATTALLGHFVFLLWFLPRAQRLKALGGGVLLLIVGVGVVALFFAGAVQSYFARALTQLPPWWVDAFRGEPLGETMVLWLLAVLMEAKAFFYCLAVWLVPIPGWMAIDLRPGIPVTLAEISGWVAIFGYLVLLIGGWGYLALGQRPFLRLAAMGVALATGHFLLEFTPYRVLDAIVLYRSYWWFTALPLVVCAAVAPLFADGVAPRWQQAATAAVASYLIAIGAVAFSYIQTFRSPEALWRHAAEVVPPQAFTEPRYYAAWRPYFNLGIVLAEKKAFAEAKEALEKARMLNGPPEWVAYHLAYVSWQLGNLAQALQEARFYISVSWPPEYPVPVGQRVLLAAEIGLAAKDYPLVFDAIARHYGVTLERLPANTPPAIKTKLVYAQAKSLVALKQVKEAVALIEAHFSQQIPEPLYLTYWDALMRAGAADRAVQAMAQVPAERFERDPAYLVSRALAYARLGELEKAREDVRKAMTLAPENPTVLRLARLLEEQGQGAQP